MKIVNCWEHAKLISNVIFWTPNKNEISFEGNEKERDFYRIYLERDNKIIDINNIDYPLLKQTKQDKNLHKKITEVHIVNCNRVDFNMNN